MKVWGAGEVTARKWYREGCRTLDDIRARSDLSEQQLVGLKYFEDFQQRIPAHVVAHVEETVQNAVSRLSVSCFGTPSKYHEVIPRERSVETL